MKTEQHKIGTVDVLTPGGALVEDDAESFCAMLSERLRGVNPRVVVAMQEVPYMDSVALEGLLDAADELGEGPNTLKLAGVTPTCREILELSGVSVKLRFFEDVPDAVRSFL